MVFPDISGENLLLIENLPDKRINRQLDDNNKRIKYIILLAEMFNRKRFFNALSNEILTHLNKNMNLASAAG